jgi:hypothetical protein
MLTPTALHAAVAPRTSAFIPSPSTPRAICASASVTASQAQPAAPNALSVSQHSAVGGGVASLNRSSQEAERPREAFSGESKAWRRPVGAEEQGPVWILRPRAGHPNGERKWEGDSSSFLYRERA